MQKSLVYFGLVMSVLYIVAGLYFLLGSVLGWTQNAFQYQNIVGGLLIGYGIFRIVRGFNQIKTLRNTQ